jgi:hypothetical protein
MNKLSAIQNINNSILNTTHASPLAIYGTEQSQERYQYQRQTPNIGIDTINTQLKKKFYGNSINRTASYITEKNRINQIGIYSNTLPIKHVNNNQSVYVENSALQKVRNRGCVLPKKCNHRTIGITPTFNGRNIALNPNNPGGNKWFNLTHNKWKKCCENNPGKVSKYYFDYLRGNLGTIYGKNNNYGNNIAGDVLQSTGYAKTYINIKNRYVFQPYNPKGF